MMKRPIIPEVEAGKLILALLIVSSSPAQQQPAKFRQILMGKSVAFQKDSWPLNFKIQYLNTDGLQACSSGGYL